LGFSALPSGGRNGYGNFVLLGDYGGWWSATELDGYDAYSRSLGFNFTEVPRDSYSQSIGFSVRCVKD
jgi:uncharacterized protein (TIGR02145 family)